MRYPVWLPSRVVLAGILVAVGPQLARPGHNYRVSGELPAVWSGSVSSLAVGGGRVLFAYSDTEQPPFGDELASVPADRSSAPLALNVSAEAPYLDARLTPDGAWAFWRIEIQQSPYETQSRLRCAPTDGSGPARFCDGEVIADGDVLDYELSPDSHRVVYRADQDADELFELYSRPVDASAPAVRLSGTLASGGDVQPGYRISPDGAWVVFRADKNTDEVFDLYSVPIDRSAPPRRLDTSAPLADVQPDFRISPLGLGVAYRADTDADEVFELFTVAVDGGGGAVKRSAPLVLGGDVLEFAWTTGDARLVYRADQATDGVEELFSVPTFAGDAVRLHPPLSGDRDVQAFEPSPDGTRVVYRADQDSEGILELYSAPVDASAAPTKLSPPLVAGRRVDQFRIDPSGARVVFSADADADEAYALFSAPLGGGAAPLRLTPAFAAPQRVASFRFSADGARVAYLSDQETPGMDELHSVPSDGSTAPVKLNGTLAGRFGVLAYEVTGGDRVVYLADEAVDAYQAFSVPISRASAPKRLNDPFVPVLTEADVQRFLVGAEGRSVVYTTTIGTGEFELQRVSLDRPGVSTRIGPRSAWPFTAVELSPDGEWIVYQTLTGFFSARADGSDAPVKLRDSGGLFEPTTTLVVCAESGALSALPIDGGSGTAFLASWPAGSQDLRLDAQGTRAAFLRATGGARHELVSVPTDGGSAASVLNDPLSAGGGVEDFEFTPDGSRIVYVADQDVDDVFELYSVPSDGSTGPTKISGALPPNGDVSIDLRPGWRFALTPDGGQVVYLADQDADEVTELYRVPVLGGLAPVKLNGPLVSGGEVGGAGCLHCQPPRHAFAITADGERVVYVADALVRFRTELFSVPLDLGSPPTKLNAPTGAQDVDDFLVAPTSDGVAYLQEVSPSDWSIHGASIDGSFDAVLLGVHGSGALPFLFHPDGTRVFFTARMNALDRDELFVAPLDGSGPARTVNGPLVFGGDVDTQDRGYALAERGDTVLYLADQDQDGRVELFATSFGARVRQSSVRR